MTKIITLNEWLDSLSPRANAIITRECNDYYFYPDKNLTLNLDADKMLEEIMSDDTSSLVRFSSRYGGSVKKEIVIPFLVSLKYKQEGRITEDAYLKFFDSYIYDDNSDLKLDNERLTCYLTLEERRKLLNNPASYYAKRVNSFISKIIQTDDFTDFKHKLDGNDMKFFKYHDVIRSEFASEDLTYDYYKKNPNEYNYSEFEKDPVMFDCLFFGKTGWNLETKKKIVKDLFGYYDVDRLAIFFRKIVAVDPYWLHSIEDVVCKYRGCAAAMENLKKNEYLLQEDVDANDNRIMVNDVFRYRKDIRKLFLIGHCCSRKSLPKTKNAAIGDIASLVRLYDFKFSDIVDCLYPDNTEPKYMPEPEVSVLES